jgi:predicted dehydrogenase
MRPAPPVATALVGLGNSGLFYHVPHLRDSLRFDLRVVASEHPETARRAAAQTGATAITGWRDAVHRPDVELVVIALPHALHHPVALEALRQGKHVLVEKPMALTVESGKELVAAADAAGRVLLVHHQRRWEEDFRTILDITRSGEIGDVWRIAVARSHQGLYHKASSDRPHDGRDVVAWAHERKGGGGIAQVVGPHPVDHLLTLAGSPPVSVAAKTHQQREDDVEDWIGIDVDFASGAMGHVEVFRWSGIAPPRFAVYGSEGTALSATPDRVDVRLKSGGGRSVEGLEIPGVLGKEVYDDLYGAIRHGTPPRVTPQAALDVVQMLELASHSAADGGSRQLWRSQVPELSKTSEKALD